MARGATPHQVAAGVKSGGLKGQSAGAGLSPVVLSSLHRELMALKEKASEMGLEDDGDDAGEGGVASGAGVDIDGIGELGPRIKIFVSNFQILNMMPVRSMSLFCVSL